MAMDGALRLLAMDGALRPLAMDGVAPVGNGRRETEICEN
jgi:hypothetical protein